MLDVWVSSLSRESPYPGAPFRSKECCPRPLILLCCPCSSCSMVPSLAARCSRSQPFLPARPLPRRTLAPGCSCLALPLPSSPFPPSRHLSAHPRCAVSRRRDHACHGGGPPSLTVKRAPNGPTPLQHPPRGYLPCYFHATSRPPSPCQGQGLCLLVYCAAACRGAMHPPSLCRDL